ncbi:MAG TPA: hypothetical protein VN521_07315 [Negativicutes bacterium]|nr:hypothetical protein [Negativicutes bacterium]
MIKRATAVTLLLAVLMTLLVFAPAVCSAAASDKQAQLKVQVSVNEPKVFWSYPYITKEDGKIRMPAAVMVEWSTTNGINSSKGQALQAGDKRGEYTISTERGAYVDVEIQIVDANKVILGKGGMQVRNNGQSVTFTIYLPDSTTPSVLGE